MPRVNHKWKVTFRGGKPLLDDPIGFKNDCMQLEGKEGFLSLVPWRKFKSLEQNKYYRGVVVQRIAEFIGATNEETHQYLSNEHLKIRNPEGSKIPYIIRSTALSEWNTEEWEEYMDFLRAWAQDEFGIRIELPNEVDLDSLSNTYY